MDKALFFATLVLFPFSQIFKSGIFNLFDGLVLLLALITFFKKPNYPTWYKYFIYFLLFCVFSLIANGSLFTVNSSLYLLRLWSYSMIAVYISNFYKEKKPIIYYLLPITLATASLGWLQYFIWPDLTALKYLGWDDHLLRMTGTFLDPTFLGLILVLGAIIALQKKYYLVVLFLTLSIALTYSRSSYLALFIVFLLDFVKFRNLKRFIICNLAFVIFLFVLPKGIGEGTTLTRTVSGNNKLINYTETIEIIKKSPLYGVGFNNICSARKIYMNDTMNDTNLESHACSGSDSSLLFLLATTGVVGLILFINFVLNTPRDVVISISFIAILIHSIFANSLFYPHIMFWMFALVGLKGEVDDKR